jgi:hypothetical protein
LIVPPAANPERASEDVQQAYRNEIYRLASRYRLEVGDLYSAFGSFADIEQNDVFRSNSSHRSAEAHAVMAHVFAEALLS